MVRGRRVANRGLFLVVALAALLGGALFGPLFEASLFDAMGAGSRAYAQEPAFVLYGFVESGAAPLPLKVRANIGGVTCGTADVTASSNAAGFYALVVVPEDQKAGCGVSGVTVQMHLIRSEIDPGVVAGQVLWRAGALLRYDLSMVASTSAGAFVGALPDAPGTAVLRWSGHSSVPVERAVATIARDVEAVHFWDVRRQQFRSWIPSAPATSDSYTLVDADDIVFVRVR